MGLAETAVLTTRLVLEDGLSAGMQSAADAVGNFGDSARTAIGNFGDTLEANKTRIREFSRAGSELGIVASVLGTDLQGTLGPLGEFIHVAGDAGLVLATVGDLGPVAIKGIQGIGAAASNAVPLVDAFTASEIRAATGAEGLAAWFLKFGLPLTAVAIESAATKDAVDKLRDSEVTWIGTQTDAATKAMSLGTAVRDTDGHIAELAGHVAEAAPIFSTLSTNVDELRGKFGDAFDAANNVATELPKVYGDPVEQAFQNLANATDDESRRLDGLAFAAAAATRNLAALNTSQTAAGQAEIARLRKLGETPDAVALFGGVSVVPFTVMATPPFTPPPGGSGSGAGSGLTQAQKDAQALAATIKGEVQDAFSQAQQVGDDYFANLHSKTLNAIQDTLNLAKAQHDSAVTAANDALAAAQRADAAPVNAAQTALAQRENAQQLQRLQESVGTAQAALLANPTDVGAQRAFRDSVESLQNFRDQLNINSLQAIQKTQDDAAQVTHDQAIKAANDALDKAQLKAKADGVKADNDYATHRKAFDTALATTEANILKHSGGIGTAFSALDRILTALLGPNTPLRYANLDRQPAINLNVNLTTPPITLNARAVSSALSANASATQASSVRMGQSRPVNVTVT